MMKNKFLVILFTLLCSGSVLSPLHASEWTEMFNQDGITLSQRTLPGKTYKQVWGTSITPGKMASLVTILDNTALCTQWLKDCRSAKTVKRISPAERIDYTVIDAPFFLQDRDMYVRSKTSYDSRTQTMTIQLSGLDKYDAGQPDKVRVLGLQGHWRFQQINEQEVKIDYLLYMDPQIKPVAAVNGSTFKDAFQTFKKLLKLAGSAQFRNVKLDAERLRAVTVR